MTHKKTAKKIFIISLISISISIAYFSSYKYLFQPYYSWRYDEKIGKMVFNHGDKPRGVKEDSIFIIDYDYHECGFDPRRFIDKRFIKYGETEASLYSADIL